MQLPIFVFLIEPSQVFAAEARSVLSGLGGSFHPAGPRTSGPPSRRRSLGATSGMRSRNEVGMCWACVGMGKKALD